jgi:hypothetical protein
VKFLIKAPARIRPAGVRVPAWQHGDCKGTPQDTFEKDPSLKEQALDDPDLEPIW